MSIAILFDFHTVFKYPMPLQDAASSHILSTAVQC